MSTVFGPRPRGGEAIVALGVGLAGAGLALHYGRVGFMPLDQSIVFDGGWRVLSGQVPVRDFTTPTGIVPIVLQAAFFRLLGVTWFAYCLHAALANGLFAVLARRLLRRWGAGPYLATLYALLSAVVFYPPFGVPYMDQHAFLFGLLGTVGVTLLVQASHRRARAGAAVLIAGAALLGYLSKPIPTVFWLPLPAAALAFVPRGERARTALVLGGSMAAGVGLLVALSARAGISPSVLVEHLVALPFRVGAPRMADAVQPWRWGTALARVTLSWRLLSVAVVHAGSLLVLARCWRRRCGPDVFLRLLMAELLLLICTAFAVLAKNEPENAIPYVFVALGLTHLNLASTVAPPPAPRGRWLAAALVALAIVDAWAFDRRVNATRLVAGVEPSVARPARLPPALSFMAWRDPGFSGLSAADLEALVSFFQANPGTFLLVGDASILYGITGRPSVNPVLWFHPRMTIPGRQTEGFRDYQERLLANLKRWRVRFVVVEAQGTFMGVRPGQLPVLVDLIQARGTPRRAFGGFELIELRPPLP